MTAEIVRDIKNKIKGNVRFNELMSRHTSLRIGGPADIWVEPEDTEDVINCVRIGRAGNMRVFVAGGGTNLLVRDEGIRGIVISMLSYLSKGIDRDRRGIWAACSVSLGELLDFCAAESLGGLEFLSGIPGSVGGAIATNAGARHYEMPENWSSIGDFIEEIEVMDYSGKTRIFTKDKLNFSYRSSGLRDAVVLSARFLLTNVTKDSILDARRKFLEKKIQTQELNAPSAGCVFRNPTGIDNSAGELIDRCGLKGARIGDAEVSGKHANFIINKGAARSSDVLALIDKIKESVEGRFGVALSTEINIV